MICPFRAFLHLMDDRERRRALEAARDLLLPGGRLVFDVFAPSAADIDETHARWIEREPGIFERADWDEAGRTLTLTVRGREGESTMTLAWISPREWRRLIRLAGLERRRLLRLVRPPGVRRRRGRDLGRAASEIATPGVRHRDLVRSGQSLNLGAVLRRSGRV